MRRRVISAYSGALGAAYIALCLLTLANYLGAGIAPSFAPADAGVSLASFTVALVLLGGAWYGRREGGYKALSCYLIGSLLAVAVTAVQLLSIATSALGAYVAGEEIGGFIELVRLDLLLGLLSIPLLRYSVKRAKLLA